MTLTVHDDLLQGSEEWLEARRGIVTASVVGRLLTTTGRVAQNDYSRSLTTLLVAERIAGWVDPVYVSDDMLRGQEDEPRAVEVYSEHFAPVTTTGFLVEDRWGFRIGYSPDGLVGDEGLIEVKSRRAKKHIATILADEIPPENYAQCQAGLLVSGREWLDYVSFCGGLPLYVKRTYPDAKWHDAILTAVATFEDNAAEMVAAYESAVAGLPMTERITDLELTL